MKHMVDLVTELKALGFEEYDGRVWYKRNVYLRDCGRKYIYFCQDARHDYMFKYENNLFYVRQDISNWDQKSLLWQRTDVDDLPSLLLLYGQGYFLNNR